MNSLFDFKHLKGDVFGGITAGIVALPLALAFGVSSGLGPSAGLYGAIFVSFFAALFGGTNTQISGPTAPMTAVSMVFIASVLALNGGDVSKSIPLILFVFLLSGLMQIGLGIIGVGSYIKFIPNPVVSGFMTAIGVIILVTQIAPTLGYYPKEDVKYVSQFTAQAEEKILEDILKAEVKDGIMVLETFEVTIAEAKKILDNEASEGLILREAKTLAGQASSGVIGTFRILPNALSNINWLELSLALGTVVIIFGFNRITGAIPSTLVALLVMSGIAYGFGLDYRSIDAIPSGLPVFNFEIFTKFDFVNVPIYLLTALTLALLGSIDSLLTSVVADNLTRTRHHSNKELIGQGIGNSIAAFFGGIPGAGATIRTVINIKSGAKTRLSGMISGVLLLVILVALSPIASKIPAAVLAGILITVGIGVMDYKGLKAIPNMPRFEVIIMLIVLVLSAVWNLVFAVGIGLIIASIMFMKEIGDLTSKGSSVKSFADDQEWSDETGISKSLNQEVFIKHLNGPLFFGSTSDFQVLSRLVPDTANTIIIRMDKVTYIDQSGKFVMEDILMNWVNEGKRVLLVGLLEQPRYMLERIDIIPQLVPREQLFSNFKDCAAWVKENVNDVV